MNHSGDAAEQIVRLSLEGVEVAAKITGTAAKEIALLIIAALKSDKKKLKTRGQARLTSMLKSGKPLEIYSVKESDLKAFTQGAKEYGIVFCALRNTQNSPDGMCDIMVRADDAPKINRLAERFKFATVDRASIENEIVASRAENAAGEQTVDNEPDAPEINDTEALLDDLLGSPEGQAAPDSPEAVQTEPHRAEAEQESRPFTGGGQPPKNPPSELTSESRSKSERGTLNKPSVKEELREIKAARKEKEAEAARLDERPAADKPKTASTTHKQPQNKKKPKKPKERS